MMFGIDNLQLKTSQLAAKQLQRTATNRTPASSSATGITAIVREKLILWSAAFAIARERKGLRSLTEAELLDMGITRAQADQESQRDFFDIPNARLTMHGFLDSSDRDY